MHILLLIFLLAPSVWALDVDRPMSDQGLDITLTTSGLGSRRGELLPPPDLFDLEELNRVYFTDYRRHSQELRRAKYYLLNGEIRLASVFLNKLAYANTKLRPVIYRYLAMLNFIEGDFRKAYDYLLTKELEATPNYSKVCTLRVLTQIILSINHNLKEQWARCSVEAFGRFRPANLWWIETLIDLKLYPRPGVTKVPFRNLNLEGASTEELKIFLKLAIFLNQEQMVMDAIPSLRVDQLQDPEVRELVGHIFFRDGSLANSYRYVEDLKSPNSENIKGNLYILRSKYELAYAQFKLALEQKQNSQNAMERLLPLAWLLGDWAQGANYAERVIASPQTIISKLTLAAAFHVQKGSFEESKAILDTITRSSRRGGEIEVTQLYSFSALMQNLPQETRKFASLSCAQYDLTNCWLLFQLGQWDAFPVMIRRDDSIKHKSEWEKLTTQDINEPLKETVYVNQLDIEELDDKLVRIVPEEKK